MTFSILVTFFACMWLFNALKLCVLPQMKSGLISTVDDMIESMFWNAKKYGWHGFRLSSAC